METITPRQQEVLDIICNFIARFRYPPSLRQIAAELGVNGTLGVMKHLDALEKKGYVRRHANSSRGIVLVRKRSKNRQPSTPSGRTPIAVRLPVVGTVRAGSPELPLEEIEDYFAIDSSQLKSGGTFFLRVKGDSMINAAITEGDLALVRPQSTAENRDIVVALVDGEATLKRFYRERGRIRLQPENPNMEPILIKPGEVEVSVIGKVVGIYRQLP
jgi:repressor LexA